MKVPCRSILTLKRHKIHSQHTKVPPLLFPHFVYLLTVCSPLPETITIYLEKNLNVKGKSYNSVLFLVTINYISNHNIALTKVSAEIWEKLVNSQSLLVVWKPPGNNKPQGSHCTRPRNICTSIFVRFTQMSYNVKNNELQRGWLAHFSYHGTEPG